MKTIRFAASATLAAATVLFGTAGFAATPTSQAGKALQYLGTQQLADGSIDDALGETADYALGAKFQGIDPKTLKASSGKSVYDYMALWLAASTNCVGKTTDRDGNTIGKLVEAVVAGGYNPTSFGGRNLLADLEGPGATTGGAYNQGTASFRDCISGGQNAVYAQANGILGLTAARNPGYPVPAAAVQRLRGQQDKSGAWATFGSTNTNATGLALMALAPLQTFCGAPTDPVLAAALAYLHGQQDPASGGFPYSSAFGAASDPDSDALVIQALVAVLQDPGSAAWTNSSGNPTTDIRTFQDAAGGGFKFDHGSGTKPDAFTTSEVPPGLDRAPFPSGTVNAVAVTCPVSPTPVASAAPRLPRAGLSRSDNAVPVAPASLVLVGLLVGGGLFARAARRRLRRD